MSFAAIDLSLLPAPDFVEPLSVDAIVAARKARLLELCPECADVLELESEPLVIDIQQAALRELLLRQRINEAARAVTLPFAQGADLDAVAARFNVTRQLLIAGDDTAIPPVPAVYESDAELRRATQLAMEGLTNAGTQGAYTYHASRAHPAVKSVSVIQTAPGEIQVTVLSREGDGTASAELLDAVNARITADEVRPLNDSVHIQGAEILNYAVEATLTLADGPDSSVVLSQAQAAVLAYVESRHQLGAEVSLSGIYAALHAQGVESVDLVSPAASLQPTQTQAAWCTGIQVN